MKRTILILGAAAFALAGCANETPAQKHEVGCIAGTLGGAVLGGVVGSAFGGGSGRAVMSALGTVGGGVAGHKLACE